MVTNEYYTILTKIGIARFIAARATGIGVDVKSFKLSSKVILPSEEMQSLDEIVYEANINNKYIDPQNDCYVNLECHIPSDVGGFEINSIGIYDNEENLLAVGNLPRTYKPRLAEGSAKELMVRVVMELSNADKVILKLDPSVIMASRDYVNGVETRLRADLAELEKKMLEELAKKENTGVAKSLDDILKEELLKLIKSSNDSLKNELTTKIEQAADLSQIQIITRTEKTSNTRTCGYFYLANKNGKQISNEAINYIDIAPTPVAGNNNS